jgi:hypothetical protein
MQYWNGTNTLVRLRTSAALTYDYEVAYQVFRDHALANSLRQPQKAGLPAYFAQRLTLGR